MQLKIQRSQRRGLTNIVIFCLDIRADYSAEEQHNIEKYRLGPQGVYNSRAAQKHFAAAEANLDRTQRGTATERARGLVKGAFSMALAHMQLNVTVGSLGRGHHIECKDLEELLEAEDTLRMACMNLTRFLEVADTFDGSEVVISYENGEEQVHIAQNMPPLLSSSADGHVYGASDDTAGYGVPQRSSDGDDVIDVGAYLLRLWDNPTCRKAAFIAGGILLLLLMLHSCA